VIDEASIPPEMGIKISSIRLNSVLMSECGKRRRRSLYVQFYWTCEQPYYCL